MQADGAMQSRPTPGDLNPAATLRFSAPTLATQRLNRDRAVSARPAASGLAFSSPATRLILTDAAPPCTLPCSAWKIGLGASCQRSPPARPPGPRPTGAPQAARPPPVRGCSQPLTAPPHSASRLAREGRQVSTQLSTMHWI